MSKLDEIKQALQAGTPGPWLQNPFTPLNVQDRHGMTVCSMAGAHAADLEDFKAELNANAHLIANAPAWLAKLIAVAEAARALLDDTRTRDRTPDQSSLRKALEAFK